MSYTFDCDIPTVIYANLESMTMQAVALLLENVSKFIDHLVQKARYEQLQIFPYLH